LLYSRSTLFVKKKSFYKGLALNLKEVNQSLKWKWPIN